MARTSTDSLSHSGSTCNKASGSCSCPHQGFEVLVIADACGDVSDEAHERAMDRMVQAGAVPMTSLQYLLELQRDWARQETYNGVFEVAAANGGAYGLGMVYASTMFSAHDGS